VRFLLEKIFEIMNYLSKVIFVQSLIFGMYVVVIDEIIYSSKSKFK
jgi:hypothetical protein